MEFSEDYISQIIKETVDSESLVKVFKNNDVFYLVMNSGMNTINWKFVKSLEKSLDEIINSEDDLSKHSLVTLSTHPKIYSNGMDLMSIKSEKDLGEIFEYTGKVLAKIVGLGMPTIAMVSGHAFAAGLYLVISHDYIIMREDKGFL